MKYRIIVISVMLFLVPIRIYPKSKYVFAPAYFELMETCLNEIIKNGLSVGPKEIINLKTQAFKENK